MTAEDRLRRAAELLHEQQDLWVRSEPRMCGHSEKQVSPTKAARIARTPYEEEIARLEAEVERSAKCSGCGMRFSDYPPGPPCHPSPMKYLSRVNTLERAVKEVRDAYRELEEAVGEALDAYLAHETAIADFSYETLDEHNAGVERWTAALARLRAAYDKVVRDE